MTVPRIHVLDDPTAQGELVAALVADALARRPDAVLGVATGSSPLPVYTALAGRAGPAPAHLVALDEYVGLPSGHPQSYRATILREVAGPLGVPAGRVHVPDGSLPDLTAAAADFEDTIAALGGVDVQLLGIGSNGHLAFNEPGSALTSRTRAVDLTARTREDNARFFGGTVDDVPRRALTQGIATLLQARSLVLVARGAAKASAVRAALLGPIDAACPASALRRHPCVTLVLDIAAASKLGMALVDLAADHDGELHPTTARPARPAMRSSR